MSKQPLWVLMLGLIGLFMWFPALYSARIDDWLVARTFFYHGLFYVILAWILALAFSSSERSRSQSVRLLDLFGVYLLLPFFLALPLDHLVPSLTLFDSYFEMLSALTTTGASLIPTPQALPDVLHFWRALVAWLGGGFILVVALAIFLPMNIGGFETYAVHRQWSDIDNEIRKANLFERISVFTARIAPLYCVLTFALALILILVGERPLNAAIFAMSTLSTSGITGGTSFESHLSGFVGEVAVFIFLVFAVSRFMYQQDGSGRGFRKLILDKENNIALLCVTLVPLLLFLRHWLAVIEDNGDWAALDGLKALWGATFTILSFLTTNGFQSSFWDTAQGWSGLGTTKLILMGFALLGGGIATTAGGIKLLRVYALYKNGLREMQKLSYPSSVLGSGRKARNIRTEGAHVAWVFFMLFTLSAAIAALGYALLGIRAEDALLLSISGLSTTGPLVPVVGETGISFVGLSVGAKLIYAATMVLGRLELLAVIAILNPQNFAEFFGRK